MGALVENYYRFSNEVSSYLKHIDGLPNLLLRLYLAPIFFSAGMGKIDLSTLMPTESTVQWFANPDWGLGLPLPALMAFMAGWTEILGGIFLLFGILVRWISIPLMATMVVAAVTAHWQFGWHALPEATLTVPWEWRQDLIAEGLQRKDAIKELLREHGNYSWLTEAGNVTILKNGIEFAATYFIMLLVLAFSGGGRYVSLDYWIEKTIGKP